MVIINYGNNYKLYPGLNLKVSMLRIPNCVKINIHSNNYSYQNLNSRYLKILN